MNPGLDLISASLVRVEETLQKADGTLQILQENLAKVTNQRIGLAAQKAMLVELKNKLEEYERLSNERPDQRAGKSIPSVGADCGTDSNQAAQKG